MTPAGMVGGGSMTSRVVLTPALGVTMVVITVTVTIVTTMEGGRGSLGLTIGILNGAGIGRGIGVTRIAVIMMMVRKRMALLGIRGIGEEVV